METNKLIGVYLEQYNYALRTHSTRTVSQEDLQLSQRYPKLTMLAMSPKFDKNMLYDIIYAKQLQETNQETSNETFERTKIIGKKLANTYLYSQNPSLRPTDEQFKVAEEKLRKRQEEDE